MRDFDDERQEFEELVVLLCGLSRTKRLCLYAFLGVLLAVGLAWARWAGTE